MMKYGQRVGRGQWGDGRNMAGGGRKGSPEWGGEGFKPRIPERVGRWPEGEGECSDRVEPSLATVRAAVASVPSTR
jgi:hypothetical protein